METQYYTPTPEEFHVGFEYENFVKHEGWTKRTLESLSDYGFNEKGFCIDHEDYRVKCLNEQDIIDLGWQRVSEDYFEIKRSSDYSEITKFKLLFSLDELTKKFYHTTIFADVELGDIKIDMMRLGFDNIKNKSELKRIMQMLKIIE
jgi:hypothetical protein